MSLLNDLIPRLRREGFFKIYVRNQRNAASLRNAMMETHTTDDPSVIPFPI